VSDEKFFTAKDAKERKDGKGKEERIFEAGDVVAE
jgi:hypothetical protein